MTILFVASFIALGLSFGVLYYAHLLLDKANRVTAINDEAAVRLGRLISDLVSVHQVPEDVLKALGEVHNPDSDVTNA